MSVTTAFDTSQGATPDKMTGRRMVGNVLGLSVQPRVRWDFSTEGTARNLKDMQSLYVDNSRNNRILYIQFMGGAYTLPVPPYTAGIFPAMCPRNMFSFEAYFEDNKVGADVQVVAFNVRVPLFTWRARNNDAARPRGYFQLTNPAAPANLPSVPANARYAVIVVSAAPIRYRDDGIDPTSTTGMPVPAGATLNYDGDLSALRIIGAGATLDIAYYG